MTDEPSSQTQPLQKEEKKPSSSGNNRGSKRQPSNSSNLRGGTSGARLASGGSNKKALTNSAAESGSDTPSRKGDGNGNNKKQEQQRGKNQTGSVRGSGHRKGQTSASHGTRNASLTKQSPCPALVQSESSDALSSLQRVIQDLRTASPAQQSLVNNQGIYIGLAIQICYSIGIRFELGSKAPQSCIVGYLHSLGQFQLVLSPLETYDGGC